MRYEFAGFWRRVVAMFIDGIIISIIGFVIGMLLALLSVGYNPILVDIIYLIVAITYSAGLTSSSWQATVGKKVMGCYVINIDGTALTFGKGVLRYFCYIISSLPLSLGYLWVAFDSKKRGFHDMIAGTYVVKE